MNHVFKLVWSRSLGMLVPVAEVVRTVGRGGRRLSLRARRRLARRGMERLGLAPLAPTALLAALVAPVAAQALPQGGQVTAGSASIASSGATMTVTQTSQKAVIDWQNFSIGANETVNFRQPGASSVALNRVLGNDPSQIFGHLTANGQIFLVNPNGVYFAPNAQVDVGGLVASTLAISNQNFLSGNYHFSGLSTASVVNFARIKTFNGGYVAFIGNVVDNEGKIVTPGGTTALGAGGAVDLTLAGDSLVSFRVSAAALNAAVSNGGAIIAPNGAVLLTAQAKEALLQTVVNNTGIIQANGASAQGGVVTLLGGSSGTVADSGSISASSATGQGGSITVTGNNVAVSGTATIAARGATGGGSIAIGGGVHGGGNIPQAVTTSIAAGALIDASATRAGAGGTVSVWSNVANAASSTRVSGSILAKGAGGGAGGYVETSGRSLNVAGANVQTGGGTWLLDPYNVTIAASNASGTAFTSNYTAGANSVILASAIDTALNANNNVVISTGAGGGSNGNITVNAAVSATGAGALTLDAAGNIVVNASVGVARLNLDYGQASAAGTGASLSINAPVTLPAGQTLSEQQGSAGAPALFTVITTQAGLQAMGTSGDYALGASFAASGAFTPLAAFSGVFEGLGNTISNLTIQKAGTSNVGLFGGNSGTIKDVGLVNVNVTGGPQTGGLVGTNTGTISNAYVTGAVTGTSNAGGLVGSNKGVIAGAYANASVSGANQVGGLAGLNYGGGTINASYAAGSVKSTYTAGGLVGYNSNATISDSYASASVNVTSTNAGGLVGSNYAGTISNVYATGAVSGGAVAVGGLIGDNRGTVGNAYATGAVSGGIGVGGLIGDNSGTVGDAYATGAVSGSSSVGGLVGKNIGTLNYGYYDTQTSVAGGAGTGETTAQLAALVGGAFSSTVWANAGGQTTPYLIANESFSTVRLLPST